MDELIITLFGGLIAIAIAVAIYRKTEQKKKDVTRTNHFTPEEQQIIQKVKDYSGSSTVTQNDINRYIEHSMALDFNEMPDWNKWDESVHHTPGQIERIRRAEQMKDPIIAYDNILHMAKVDGTERTYLVSANRCSCPDFRSRHLPCKHMYSLAMALEGNSEKLIPDRSKAPLYGLRIALAGRFPGSANGEDGIRARINSAGGIWKNNVDKDTDLLLIGNSPSESKLAFAKSIDLEIVDSEKLFSLFTKEG